EGGHRIYAAAASKRFVDVGLELGGKDAAYVAEDADLEKAADSLVDGACYNAGQSCCGIERVYVHRSLYDRFVDAALPLMRAYRLGDPSAEGTTMGPMAQPWAPETIARQIKQAVAGGAKVLTGGSPTQIEGRGRFFEPTLLVGTKPGMDV